ncbi:TetR/AcrR family transcriptional regulator [Actinoplanes sichuanensis]|uniref:TetR/AcrR family transcriptional regulator n=1 Tax=Actinoplanes sichuanensis TaxID=512349 RepID=A0ABW4A433_9ACTN|nr:TetR/AcrR family transcriptional regulator [Actinoplanes sichuanensis]
MVLPTPQPATDRRVRRTRSALMSAAVALVAERGTTAVALSDIAEAADVSRRVVYQHFGDRDTLLLEAGLDLARRELLPALTDEAPVASRERALPVARHFAQHRAFYRALLTGSCAFALDRGLLRLILPVNRHGLQTVHGDRLTARAVEDLATFVTGGVGALVTSWVVDGPDPLDPEEFTDRLLAATSVMMTALNERIVDEHPEPDHPAAPATASADHP